MADDLDDLDEAEGGPQPAEGRELVIVDLSHMTMMPGSADWLERLRTGDAVGQGRQATRSAL
jgi:hypothetical protein